MTRQGRETMRSAEEPETNAESIVILLVEDEVLIRIDLADRLRDAGWTVYEAGNADAALELLLSTMRIDVLVTDVRMPGKLNGVCLAEITRESRPDVKIVVMSGDYRPERGPPADAFLAKPFEPPALVARIRALTRGRDADAE